MTGFFFVVLACFLWALDTLIRYPLMGAGYSPGMIVFCEHLLLCLILAPIIIKFVKKIWHFKVSDIFYFMVIGGVGSALATLSFTKAFSILNPSLVILLQKFQPVFAIILARIVLKEKLIQQYYLWASVCLLGAILISYQDIRPLFESSFDVKSGTLVGYGLTLFSIIGWGASTVFGKALEQSGHETQDIMAGRFLFGFLFVIPLFINGGATIPTASLYWGKLALMVLISGLLGMYFYYRGLKLLSARLCTLAEMFFPFCAIVLNWIFLEAKLDALQMGGAILLLLGSTIIKFKQY